MATEGKSSQDNACYGAGCTMFIICVVLVILQLVAIFATKRSCSGLAFLPPIACGLIIVSGYFDSAIDHEDKAPFGKRRLVLLAVVLGLWFPALCLHVTPEDSAGYVFIHPDGTITTSTWMWPLTTRKARITWQIRAELKEPSQNVDIFYLVKQAKGQKAIAAYLALGEKNCLATNAIRDELSHSLPDESAKSIAGRIDRRMDKEGYSPFLEPISVSIYYTPPRRM